MEKTLREFTIKKLREPVEKKLEQDIQWICDSLGFLTPRDQDKTAFKILEALINAARERKGLTSEELTEYVKPTVGSVIYHLKKLMRSGLVVKFDSVYELRMNSFLKTIEEIEKEIRITLSDIKVIARDIDDRVGLAHRS